MNKYALGIVLAILIVLIGIWYFRQYRRPDTSGEVTPRPQVDETQTIPY